MKTIKFILFLLVALAMIAVPAMMIYRAESTLKGGNEYIFKAAPVDPYDFFRGRYVSINVEPRFVKQKYCNFKHGERVYALLADGKDGLATISRLQRERPQHGDYIKVKFTWQNGDENYIQMPFERYYMNEKLAPEAERIVRLAMSRDSQKKCTVNVRVLNGKAVIDNVYIDNMPLREYVLKHSAK